MLAGRCDEGKALLRRSRALQSSPPLGPEQVENVVEAVNIQYCLGQLTPREQLLKASGELQRAAFTSVDAASCARSYETVKRLATTVAPRSEDDHPVKGALSPTSQGMSAAQCFVRAGDCSSARRAYDDALGGTPGRISRLSPAQSRAAFDASFERCKGR